MFGKKKKKAEGEEGKEAEDKKEEGGKKEDAGAKKEGEEGKEGAEGGEAAPKSKKKLIIIIVIALVVLIGGGAGAFFALSGKSEEHAEGAAEGEEGKEGEKKAGTYYTLPEFLVNLNSGGKQTSFLKMTIVLELDSGMDVMPLEGALPKLLDGYNTYLRELRASDLAGSAGIQRLREELLLRANKSLGNIKVNDVLFKEIIVQ